MQNNENSSPMPSGGSPIKKGERNAIIIGFLLIIFVLILTLFRSFDFGKKEQIRNTDTNKSSQTKTPEYKTISAKDLQQKMLVNEKMILLDVRKFESYINEHILDSINAPAGEIPQGVTINPNDSIIVIAENSEDENINSAVNKLKEKDFKSFIVLSGGFDAWSKNSGQTIKFGDPTSFIDQAKVSFIELDKANELVKNNPNLFILDIRQSSDFTQGHIANATNIPFLELEKNRNKINSRKQILIIGSTEVQQFQAGVQIYDMFLNSPVIVKGTMQQWQEKGFEVVK